MAKTVLIMSIPSELTGVMKWESGLSLLGECLVEVNYEGDPTQGPLIARKQIELPPGTKTVSMAVVTADINGPLNAPLQGIAFEALNRGISDSNPPVLDFQFLAMPKPEPQAPWVGRFNIRVMAFGTPQ